MFLSEKGSQKTHLLLPNLLDLNGSEQTERLVWRLPYTHSTALPQASFIHQEIRHFLPEGTELLIMDVSKKAKISSVDKRSKYSLYAE